ncbi:MULTISPECIES: DivIVA domain-containing protein [Brevibacterium]|uniref:DivIVA domain-containing protein n=1 Tax=Brevibacterium sediminis TaxID=1857024 RepID=A0A5C4X5H2_9MICO|nr:DivIVA domain-containing protein [Brevibacterium sediminis]MCS4591727.1 DivIVA domain-containing protein [Brevibacterium sediminis]TNM57870.1 DivIVA domain-containing protein [Brevibacterium sediminis]
MPLWIVIGVAAAVFVLVFVVAATFNVFSSETVDEAEESWTGLPAEFTVKDLESVRFRPALRGYRMEDVDAAMAMLRARLSELETAAAPAEAASPTRPTTSPDGPETAAGPR